jgi:hypothetical protein
MDRPPAIATSAASATDAMRPEHQLSIHTNVPFRIDETIIEAPRLFRRLNTLRGLSHEEVKQVFTRGA